MLYDALLAREAKAMVALAFHSGPLEDLHAGKPCPECHGTSEYSRITDEQMQTVIRAVVDRIYSLLWLKKRKPEVFTAFIALGSAYAFSWNEPDFTSQF
jgi:hypothetical protein